jgi:hypothetical protein
MLLVAADPGSRIPAAKGRTGANLLALRQPGAHEFTPSPSLSTTLCAGAVLILFGSRRQTADLARLLGP